MVVAGADGGAGQDTQRGWRWDVALSFAGAQRDYVEQVAQALKARGVRCFYDADEEIELWGKYLADELPVIYGEQTAAAVVFVSAELGRHSRVVCTGQALSGGLAAVLAAVTPERLRSSTVC